MKLSTSILPANFPTSILTVFTGPVLVVPGQLLRTGVDAVGMDPSLAGVAFKHLIDVLVGDANLECKDWIMKMN